LLSHGAHIEDDNIDCYTLVDHDDDDDVILEEIAIRNKDKK
jgi:hypothetical protein